MRAEINEIENTNTKERINRTNIWLYKINKFDKPLMRLTKKIERICKLPVPEIKESSLLILSILRG